MSLIQMAVLAIVSLILGLFVIRPILTKPVAATALLPADRRPESEDAPFLVGEIATADGVEFAQIPSQAKQAEVPALGSPAGTDPVDRLRAMIGEKQEETVEILRSWLEEGEEAV